MLRRVMTAVGVVALSCAQSSSTADTMSISLPVRYPFNLPGVAASVVAVGSDQTTVAFECPPVLTTGLCDPRLDHHVTLSPPTDTAPGNDKAAIYRGGWVTWHEDQWCRVDSKTVYTEDLASESTNIPSTVSSVPTQEDDLELRAPATDSDTNLQTTSRSSITSSSKASVTSPQSTEETPESTESRLGILIATGSPIIPSQSSTASESGADGHGTLCLDWRNLEFAAVVAGVVGGILIL